MKQLKQRLPIQFILVFILINLGQQIQATTPDPALPSQATLSLVPKKYYAWSFGLHLNHHQLKSSQNDNPFIGNNTELNFGFAYAKSLWLLESSLSVILGPYTTLRSEKIKTDFWGTGINLLANYALNTNNIRAPEGSYGPTFMMSYQDITGQAISIGKHNDLTITNYSTRISYFALGVGFFYASLLPARLNTSKPEDLITRIEGQYFQVNILIPVQAHYHATLTSHDLNSQASSEPATTREKGEYKGYSLQISYKILLGV